MARAPDFNAHMNREPAHPQKTTPATKKQPRRMAVEGDAPALDTCAEITLGLALEDETK